MPHVSNVCLPSLLWKMKLQYDLGMATQKTGFIGSSPTRAVPPASISCRPKLVCCVHNIMSLLGAMFHRADKGLGLSIAGGLGSTPYKAGPPPLCANIWGTPILFGSSRRQNFDTLPANTVGLKNICWLATVGTFLYYYF